MFSFYSTFYRGGGPNEMVASVLISFFKHIPLEGMLYQWMYFDFCCFTRELALLVASLLL